MKLYILALKIYYAISIWNYIYNYLKKIWLILKKEKWLTKILIESLNIK